jgi:hypothetical protein
VKVVVAKSVSQRLVDELGIDPALRMRDRAIRALADAGRYSGNRHSQAPGCFLCRLPAVVSSKGGWFECTFTVNDHTPGELHVVGVVIEFRPIGPM